MGTNLFYTTTPEKLPFKHLFEYNMSDLIMNVFIFTDVVLKEQIGEFAPGTQFPRATLRCNSGRLTLCEQTVDNPLTLKNNDLYDKPVEGYYQFQLRFITT